jgi:hypothetical protein
MSGGTIFLLGAGASHPAGIPTIPEMTKKFLENPYRAKDGDIRRSSNSNTPWVRRQFKAIETLSKTAQEHYGKDTPDLELMMSLILELQDSNSRKLFQSKYKEIAEIEDGELNTTRFLINDHIRKECENISSESVEYLWPLQSQSIMSNKMNIFTLNYDGTIEIFCEKHNIDFSDGFDLYWNPDSFENAKVNIFKLHGSLYWFRTESGKIIKVPAKGFTVKFLRYLSDEQLSEMMIYPALRKNKQSEVYLWLHGTFINELNRATTCVIIGYSFRDEDIVNNLVDALNRNPDLWLLIISPNATDYKNKHFNQNLDHASRVVTLSKKIEDVVTERKLDKYLGALIDARNHEKGMWIKLAESDDQNIIQDAIRRYRNIYGYGPNPNPIQHEDRVRWINETLSKRNVLS